MPQTQELTGQISAIEGEIHQRSRQLVAEPNPDVCFALKAEIAELRKRHGLLGKLKKERSQTQEAVFREFADYKYEHLPPEVQQSISDLGGLFELSPQELKQNFPAFAQVMAQKDKRQTLQSAIRKKRQRENQILDLEKQLQHQEKTTRELRAKGESQKAENSKLRIELTHSLESVSALEVRCVEQKDSSDCDLKQADEQYHELVCENQGLREEAIGYRREAEDGREEFQNLEKVLLSRQDQLNIAQLELENHKEQAEISLEETRSESQQWRELSEQCALKRDQLELTERELKTTVSKLKEKLDHQRREIKKQKRQLDQGKSREGHFTQEKRQLISESTQLREQLDREEETRALHARRIMEVHRLHREHWGDDHRHVFTTDDEFEYGFVVASVWLEVNRGKSKSSAVFEERVTALVHEHDWQIRLCGEEKKAAVRDANDFQSGRLFYEDAATISPVDTYPELYENILSFSDHGKQWRANFEYQEFLDGQHPQQKRIWALLEKLDLPSDDVSPEKFMALRKRYPHSFQDIDKQKGEGVE